jgi:hypothetical protein
MKTPPLPLSSASILVLIAFLSLPAFGSEVVTLTVNGVASSKSYSAMITLGAGDVATLESAGDEKPYVEIFVGGVLFEEPSFTPIASGGWVLRPHKVAGPATIRLMIESGSIPTNSWGTFTINRATAIENAIPANAVVIPEEAGGQFQVILESSTDLINWQTANPGNYGGSTIRRFFRTRIVRLN